jgi:hypothetical protein
MKRPALLIFLFRDFRDFFKSAHDGGIVSSYMRENALAAILDPFFGIEAIPAAALSQGIKRAKAEQAVEILRPFSGMARKILAFCVAKEKSLFLLFLLTAHNTLLSIFPNMLHGLSVQPAYSVSFSSGSPLISHRASREGKAARLR